MRATLQTMRKKNCISFAEGCGVTEQAIEMVIQCIHNCGYFFVKKGTVRQFDMYCKKVHDVFMSGLIGREAELLREEIRARRES